MMFKTLFSEHQLFYANNDLSYAKDINELPDELLARIFRYLHPIKDELPLLAFVCSKWRDVLQTHGILWRQIHVDPNYFAMYHFSLLCSMFRNYGYHIQRLSWRESSPVFRSVFSLIPTLSNLRSLRLPILWTPEVLHKLSTLSNLEQVQINGGYELTDDELEQIMVYFPNLREISLNACWRITSIGVKRLLSKLPFLETVKLKLNSGLDINDRRSDDAIARGFGIARNIVDNSTVHLVKVLCIHFLPIEVDELWEIVNKLPCLKKLSISNCEYIHGVRLLSDSLVKVCLHNLWNVLFVSLDISSLRFLTVDVGLASIEHLEVTSDNLRKVTVNGSNVLRTMKIKSQKLTFLELKQCEEIEMRSFKETLRNNDKLVCLRLGCISHDSLTLDEYTVPNLQELCLLGDFACETLHIRSPTLRFIHVEAEMDIVTLNHMYITANHLCRVALVGMPALKTLTIQCVSVDSIEMNLCSDDQLNLESCVIHAMNAIGFLRFFDCNVNLLCISTPLVKTVVLYRCQMTDYTLQMVLAGCTKIAHLNLEKCRRVTNVAIASPPLKFLNMYGCNDLLQLSLNNCPQMIAVNLGQCPNVKLFIRGIEQDLTALCTSLQIVHPKEFVRWSHDFPPKPYICPIEY
ncbi:uncharacterized protein LOC143067300 [Mytilus galloprovincialis]|uniref:uncharacterized protein LOC143067300 n=1 Tax=Mytilus galloprovincialis TaxID=29158 RepID=UPI003F7BB9B1